jgi:hypothetical protein
LSNLGGLESKKGNFNPWEVRRMQAKRLKKKGVPRKTITKAVGRDAEDLSKKASLEFLLFHLHHFTSIGKH